MADANTGRLITLAVSHFCEKARWGLELTGIPFTEEAHIPGWHKVATSSVGGTSVPVFVASNGKAYVQSSDILHYADENSKTGVKLYPTDPALLTQAQELESLFDQKLGPATRRWVYFYLLDNRDVVVALLTKNVSSAESIAFSVGYFALKEIMRSGMAISEQGCVESKALIDEVFEKVNSLLSDGRQFLLGSSFSAADIAFASLCNPLLMPPESPATDKEIQAKISKEYLEISAKYRETPAGQFALRLYKEQRKPSSTSTN